MHNPVLRHAILAASAALALTLLPASLAQAQGMPGATVGLPMGSPDTFGLSTVNRPSGYDAEPSAEPGMDRPERRIRPRPHRQLKSHRNAAPKQRAPLARR
ncbi:MULTISPECIES: hypothetical protein [Methylorubrum]|uniref:hypothetical protein n=1 Tax=Methylorubrum TaxID=2282523 RepID=UPI00209DF44F|nr:MULTISPECIES: hypothetical protein [Methylorubrum]MCP1551342.1 hypothetical protein [Methylorubrum zatmanii]MCP1552042.1 hypothetical protein [Methylorubrum extorquens]MCP1581647.1 hypothetical protein [Methylorubrum extorquens]